MPRPTVAAIAIVMVGVVAVFLLVGRSDTDAPTTSLAISQTELPESPESAPVDDGRLVPNAVVEYVVDGDTIDVTIAGVDERVRFIGVDTPETKRPDSPVECYGPEASAFTEDLLAVGTPVRIERDTVGRDDYGRLLGYVYRADDGVFVNYEIVRQGFARPLSIAPNTVHESLFVDAARAAEADDLGMWAAC